MRVLIVGCGYVGFPLGVELVRLGHEVYGIRRSAGGAEELAAAGIHFIAADISKPDDLAAIPGPFDWVANCVSSGKGGTDEYRAAFLGGTKNLIAWLSGMPLKKYVHIGSTSVYGQTDGSPVKESSSTDPASETSRILVEVEKTVLAAAMTRKFPAVILRAAGIYGPERGHLFLKYLKNEARVSGTGARFINMIHRDDLVGSIVAALRNGRPGEVYNVVDDEPIAQLHFLRWLSETLGKWMPPTEPADEAAGRKRGVTNKRVQNRKLKMELGYQFKYPNFRQGYSAEILRLDRSGRLNIVLEPR